MELLSRLRYMISIRYYCYQACKNGFKIEYLEKLITTIFNHADIPDNTYLRFESTDVVSSTTSEVNLVNPDIEIEYLKKDGANITSSYTTMDDDGKAFVVVSLEILQAEIKILNKIKNGVSISHLLEVINGLVLHEVWHAYQFRYIFDTHGNQALIDVCTQEREYPYGEGPLESGAMDYSYSNGSMKQDLKKVFG